MSDLVSWVKKEVGRLSIHKPVKRLQLLPTSTAIPLVQEVTLAADLRCAQCQKRVADLISKMDNMESVLVHVVQKKVTLTCKSATN
ncbi:hypothetical protein F0562_001696 [Nyssa sinensis]|uniref:HMA domain-containing protein n=1 Tax=Nyssa sinensis TaxID=561372 RepID=A0A5J5C7T2_9ASTE|nr:hypothetical protein F0562_001696 [Nyssa sinensis]